MSTEKEDIIQTLSNAELVAKALDHGYVAMSVEVLGVLLKKVEDDDERIAIMSEGKTAIWLDSKGNPVEMDENGDVCCSGGVVCGECGDWLTGSDEYGCKGKFCPNCGLRMQRKGEGDG